MFFAYFFMWTLLPFFGKILVITELSLKFFSVLYCGNVSITPVFITREGSYLFSVFYLSFLFLTTPEGSYLFSVFY